MCRAVRTVTLRVALLAVALLAVAIAVAGEVADKDDYDEKSSRRLLHRRKLYTITLG